SAPVRALLAARGPLTVPAAEEPVFLRDAYPVLARRIAVHAAGGVQLPTVPAPAATIVISHHRGDTVRYAFEWEYRGYGRFPFDPTTDAVRDEAAEAAARLDLEAAWTEETGLRFEPSGSFHDVEAAEFVTHIVPALEKRGITAVVSGRRKIYRELDGEPEITVSTVESSDPDWFDLGILVKIDGRSIPFTPLFTALS